MGVSEDMILIFQHLRIHICTWLSKGLITCKYVFLLLGGESSNGSNDLYISKLSFIDADMRIYLYILQINLRKGCFSAIFEDNAYIILLAVSPFETKQK
jgi:hypothetical protein